MRKRQTDGVVATDLIVRLALSGRLLMSGLVLLPIVFIAGNPDLAVVGVAATLIIAFFAIQLWRLHVYADANVVALRGGQGRMNVDAHGLPPLPTDGCCH